MVEAAPQGNARFLFAGSATSFVSSYDPLVPVSFYICVFWCISLSSMELSLLVYVWVLSGGCFIWDSFLRPKLVSSFQNLTYPCIIKKTSRVQFASVTIYMMKYKNL